MKNIGNRLMNRVTITSFVVLGFMIMRDFNIIQIDSEIISEYSTLIVSGLLAAGIINDPTTANKGLGDDPDPDDESSEEESGYLDDEEEV